eukprot:m.113763 g.113763  ORF g.113763 m.113763 type:complete len:1220 (-) comp13523_c0_seq8:1129-4788(-)
MDGAMKLTEDTFQDVCKFWWENSDVFVPLVSLSRNDLGREADVLQRKGAIRDALVDLLAGETDDDGMEDGEDDDAASANALFLSNMLSAALMSDDEMVVGGAARLLTFVCSPASGATYIPLAKHDVAGPQLVAACVGILATAPDERALPVSTMVEVAFALGTFMLVAIAHMELQGDMEEKMRSVTQLVVSREEDAVGCLLAWTLLSTLPASLLFDRHEFDFEFLPAVQGVLDDMLDPQQAGTELQSAVVSALSLFIDSLNDPALFISLLTLTATYATNDGIVEGVSADVRERIDYHATIAVSRLADAIAAMEYLECVPVAVQIISAVFAQCFKPRYLCNYLFMLSTMELSEASDQVVVSVVRSILPKAIEIAPALLQVPDAETWVKLAPTSTHAEEEEVDIGDEYLRSLCDTVDAISLEFPEAMFPLLWKTFRTKCNGSFEERYVALLLMHVTAEGCKEQMSKKICVKLWSGLYSNMQHEDPRIRYAALQALGQCSTDLEPEDFHVPLADTITAAFIQMLDDPVERVLSHTLAASVNFYEELPSEQAVVCANPIFIRLMECLKSAPSILIQERCVTAIAAVATQLDNGRLDPYFDEFSRAFWELLVQCPFDTPYSSLRMRTLEAVTIFIISISKDRALEQLAGVFQLVLGLPEFEHLKSPTNDKFTMDIAAYVFKGLQRIELTYRESIFPFLGQVLPVVKSILALSLETTVIPRGVEESALEHHIFDDGDLIVGVPKWQLEAKEVACHLIAVMFSNKTPPEVSALPVASLLQSFLSAPMDLLNEDTTVAFYSTLYTLFFLLPPQEQAIFAPPMLSKIKSDIEAALQQTDLVDALERMAFIVQLIADNPEVNAASLNASAREIFSQIEQALPMLAEFVKTHLDMADQVGAGKRDKKGGDESGGDDDDDDDDDVMGAGDDEIGEEDDSDGEWEDVDEDDEDGDGLERSLGDETVVFTMASRPGEMLVSLSRLFPERGERLVIRAINTFLPYAGRTPPVSALALSIFADAVRYGTKELASVAALMKPVVMDALTSDDPSLVQMAAYATGHMANSKVADFKEECLQALPILRAFVTRKSARDKDNRVASETAITAMSNIMRKYMKPADYWDELLSYLPLQCDPEDVADTYQNMLATVDDLSEEQIKRVAMLCTANVEQLLETPTLMFLEQKNTYRAMCYLQTFVKNPRVAATLAAMEPEEAGMGEDSFSSKLAQVLSHVTATE